MILFQYDQLMSTRTLTIIALFLANSTTAFSQSADSADYYYKKGLEERNNRRFLPALGYFQKSTGYKSDHADAQKELALTAMEINKNELAIPAFNKLLTLKKMILSP